MGVDEGGGEQVCTMDWCSPAIAHFAPKCGTPPDSPPAVEAGGLSDPSLPPPSCSRPPLPSQVVPLELGAVSSKLPGATNAMVLRQPNLAIGGDWVVEIIANK